MDGSWGNDSCDDAEVAPNCETVTYDGEDQAGEDTGEEPAGTPVTCNGLTATIVGTDGDDTIFGTWQDDVIVGLGGNDQIYGQSGADVICGGDGDDFIDGASQDDTIFGEVGNDTVVGQSGADEIYGGPGDDILQGDSQDDAIAGGPGDDQINGGPGSDNLAGGDGVDTIDGSWQDDTCSGGETYLSCESVDEPPVDQPTVSCEGVPATIVGTEQAETLNGTDGADVIVGLGGNDIINGLAGDDLICGGEGNDTISGGDGTDTCFGEFVEECEALIDADEDGVIREVEAVFGTSESLADTDGDGLTDAFEIALGLPALDPTVADTDGDGISDGDEDEDEDGLTAQQEQELPSNPQRFDSDNDGLSDAEESAAGTNHLSADTDGDLLSDGAELRAGTNPLLADSDGDGVSDGEESITATVTAPDMGIVVQVTGVGDIAGSTRIFTPEYPVTVDPDGGLSPQFNVELPPLVEEALEAASITVSIPADVPVDGDLALFTFDSGLPGWLPAAPLTEQIIDPINRTVTANVTHFSPHRIQSVSAWRSFFVTAAAATDPCRQTFEPIPDDPLEEENDQVIIAKSSPTLGSNLRMISGGFKAVLRRALQAISQDTDGDGIDDCYEIRGVPTTFGTFITDPNNPDTDGDGLSDGFEVGDITDTLTRFGDLDPFATGTSVFSGGFSNPTVTNSDRSNPQPIWLDDFEEHQYGTDPFQYDQDGDREPDWREVVVVGSNPAHWNSDNTDPRLVTTDTGDYWSDFSEARRLPGDPFRPLDAYGNPLPSGQEDPLYPYEGGGYTFDQQRVTVQLAMACGDFGTACPTALFTAVGQQLPPTIQQVGSGPYMLGLIARGLIFGVVDDFSNVIAGIDQGDPKIVIPALIGLLIPIAGKTFLAASGKIFGYISRLNRAGKNRTFRYLIQNRAAINSSFAQTMPDSFLLNFLGRFGEFNNLGLLRSAIGDRNTINFLEASLESASGTRVDELVDAITSPFGSWRNDVTKALPDWPEAELLDRELSGFLNAQKRIDFNPADVRAAVRARANQLSGADREFILNKLNSTTIRNHRFADSAQNPRGQPGPYREVKHGKHACNNAWHQMFADFYLAQQQTGNSASWHLYSGGSTGAPCQNASFYRMMQLLEIPFTVHFPA